MAYNEALAERIRAALAETPGVDEKRMFGGLSFMVGGQMCCGVLKDELVVRIDAAEFDQLVAQGHVRPFDFTGRPMQNMVYVGLPALTTDAALHTWIQRGVAYNATHPRTTRRKKARAPLTGP